MNTSQRQWPKLPIPPPWNHPTTTSRLNEVVPAFVCIRRHNCIDYVPPVYLCLKIRPEKTQSFCCCFKMSQKDPNRTKHKMIIKECYQFYEPHNLTAIVSYHNHCDSRMRSDKFQRCPKGISITWHSWKTRVHLFLIAFQCVNEIVRLCFCFIRWCFTFPSPPKP